MTDPTRLLFLVHPDNLETPPEALRIEVFARLDGYVRDEVVKASRETSRHCPKGYGYLIHNPHWDAKTWAGGAEAYFMMKEQKP